MLKKLLIGVMCICLCAAVGCAKEPESLSVDKADVESVESKPVEEKPVYYVNPLTGIGNLDKETAGRRPVAITINNISVAQTVQTGVGSADVVYETEVEAGITRLVAVYQDITKLEKIGTVRSARYPFVDLAMGHNAIYVHHGQDVIYAASHLKDVDHFTVDTNAGGVRVSNGLAREHTLYAYGDGLWQALVNAGFKTEAKSSESWQSFVNEDEVIQLENTANAVSVPFSKGYKTTFKFDTETGKYVRYFNGVERKDYITGQSLYFKNVFVLNTTIRDYPDGYHRQVFLDSGDGYYFSNGTYTPIKWSKGAASNKFTFTKADGTELLVNAGNSWVCIANSSTSQPIIE